MGESFSKKVEGKDDADIVHYVSNDTYLIEETVKEMHQMARLGTEVADNLIMIMLERMEEDPKGEMATRLRAIVNDD